MILDPSSKYVTKIRKTEDDKKVQDNKMSSKHKLPIYTYVISPAVYFVEIRFRLIALWGTIY